MSPRLHPAMQDYPQAGVKIFEVPVPRPDTSRRGGGIIKKFAGPAHPTALETFFVQPEANIRERNLFPIGRVVKPHGVKGRVKVEYFGEDLRRITLYREIFIKDEKDNPEAYEVLEAIPQPPRLILRLKGIERIEEAEPLIGKEILIEKEALLELGEGEYYWVDILGMKVATEGGKGIGKVREIFRTGANDVYVVEGKRGEILLPATEEVIRSIDVKRGVMKVVRMEGLWEDEDEV